LEEKIKALVLGGAGFLGCHTVDALLERGCKVTAVDNLERGKAENLAHCMDRITFIRSDLKQEQPIGLDAAGGLVFDFAAKVFGIRHLYAAPWTLMVDNLQIVMNNLKRWGNAKKYIYISSSCVYDWEGVPMPHKEDDMGYLNSFYGWSKLFGELCCQALNEEKGLDYTVLRPFNVYGTRESSLHPHVIPDFVRKACDCKFRDVKTFEILGDGKQTRSFTYISDVVDCIMLAAEAGRRTAYNISYPEETTILSLAETIWDIMGISPEPVFVPAPEQEVKLRCGSSVKAERELGWKPKVGLREGLEKTLEWMVPLIEDRVGKTELR